MFQDNFYRDHFVFQSCNDVLDLCDSFFSDAKINYFDYTRTYNNHDFLLLASDGYWVEHFFKREFYVSGTLKNSGIHLWNNHHSKSMVTDARSFSNHDNGITFFEKHADYIESYSFAAPVENFSVVDFYFNHIDFLKKFISLFKENGCKLIKLAEKNKIVLTENMIGEIIPDSYCKDDFIKGIFDKRKLSNRESQCLYYIIRGKSCNEIASILGISSRTVQVYINNLKEKFKVYNKKQVIEKALISGYYGIIPDSIL